MSDEESRVVWRERAVGAFSAENWAESERARRKGPSFPSLPTNGAGKGVPALR